MTNYKLDILKALDNLEKFDYSRRRIEQKLGYSERYIDQQVSKGGNKKMLQGLTKLLEEQKKSNPEVDLTERDEIKAYKLEKEQQKATEKQHDNTSPELASRALLNLTETNKLLAESHKVIAESNKTLADNNRDLIDMFKASAVTDVAPQQTLAAVLSTIRNLQELTVDIALGKKFGSKQEVNALLNKSHISTFQRET